MDRSRFEGLLPIERIDPLTVCGVGAGGIGMYTYTRLCQMGFSKFTIIDHDVVEDANVSTQDFHMGYVYWHKAAAAGDKLRRLNPAINSLELSVSWDEVSAVTRGRCMRSSIFVLAVDSLATRAAIVDEMNRSAKWPGLLVDPRMGLESLEVWFVRARPFEPRWAEYESSLRDRDIAPLPCSARAVAYTGSFAADVIASQVRRHAMGGRFPYNVQADLGSLQTVTLWREGEQFNEV